MSRARNRRSLVCAGAPAAARHAYAEPLRVTPRLMGSIGRSGAIACCAPRQPGRSGMYPAHVARGRARTFVWYVIRSEVPKPNRGDVERVDGTCSGRHAWLQPPWQRVTRT